VDFADSEEHRALRSAVAGIAAKFGPRYYAEHAAARRPCDELWQALGDAGFIGVNIPEEYGGGGGGLTELALVCEEIAAAGTPLLLLRVTGAALGVGVARYALGAAAGYANERRVWAEPIGAHQGVSHPLAKAALAALDAAIQAHGGNGLSSEYGLMPYWGLPRSY